MEVRSFLEHWKTKEEGKKEWFFVLQISSEVVKSAVWGVEEEKVRIVSLGEEIGWSSPEELLAAADTSLSAAIGRLNLPAGAEEPSRVIFGLPSSWVERDRIVEGKMGELKELSQKLGLKPAGFVVVPEAIVYYLKVMEGVPPTAILVEVGKRRLFLSLVNLGKIEVNEEVERSDNFGADVAEGLSRFGTNHYFPPRIILYNGEEKIEDLGQELMAYSWVGAGINFLHLPKVEVLAPKMGVRAVALAGGQELAQAVGVAEEVEMGMRVEPQQVAELSEAVEPQPRELPSEEPKLGEPEVVLTKEIEASARGKEEKKLGARLNWRWRGRALKVLGGAILALGGVVGGLFWLYWNWPAAEITLGVENKFIEEELVLKLKEGVSKEDEEKMILPGYLKEVAAEGEGSQATTGKKVVGEAAKGEVRIYNNTAKEKRFATGTMITSGSGLRFGLEEEVVIASHSSALEVVPSAVVKVVAGKLGTDYNLAAGTEFTVANLAKSDFAAKNESAFSGGSSEEVMAVAVKDQEGLEEKLSEEIKGRAMGELRKKVEEGQKLIEESVTKKMVSRKFDKVVGEEAEQVNLKLKLTFQALSYQEEEVKGLIEKRVKQLIPAGYQYQEEGVEMSFGLKSWDKEGGAVFKVMVRAKVQPELDLTAISMNLAGKQVELGRDYLVNLPNVVRVEIRVRPTLPEKIATLPHRWERIKIKLAGE